MAHMPAQLRQFYGSKEAAAPRRFLVSGIGYLGLAAGFGLGQFADGGVHLSCWFDMVKMCSAWNCQGSVFL